jgi:hypothetical protein
MYLYKFTCLHVYMFTCLHVYMSTCLHVYMFTCLHVYMVYMFTCLLDHIYMYMFIQDAGKPAVSGAKVRKFL